MCGSRRKKSERERKEEEEEEEEGWGVEIEVHFFEIRFNVWCVVFLTRTFRDEVRG